MKVVIMSDTHGLEEVIENVYKAHESDADMFFHCGDSELIIDHPAWHTFKTVKGNVDAIDCGFPNQVVEEIGQLKWLIVHGHQDGVKRDLLNLNYKAESLGANVICFGHTHVAGAESYDGKIFINPGSLRSPRLRVEKTYAVCDWKNPDSPFNVYFYTEQGEKLESLSRTFSFKLS